MDREQDSTNGRPAIWAVGGGKGGTGKSLVAASLGIHLAEMGRRVTLVDGDLGAPNLHTFLGLDPSGVCLTDVVKRNVDSLEEAAVETGIPRLRLVSGARNSLDAESLKHFEKTRLLRLLTGLGADVVLLDLGAGTSLNVLDFFSIADRGVVVILPEPTSVENCYRFVRAAFLRRLLLAGRTLGFQDAVQLVLAHRERSHPVRPLEILEEIRRVDSFAAAEIAAQIEAFQPHLVVNQVRDREDDRIGDSIETISDRFLGIPLRFAGSVPYDPVLVRSVKSRRPYLVEYPRSRTSEAFRAAAEMIHDPWPAKPAPAEALYPRPSAADRDRALEPYHTRDPYRARDLYRALDLAPGATHEEILAAYVRLRPALRSDSPALVSLDCEPERRAALVEIEDAFRALSRNLSTQASSGHRRAGA